MLYVELSLKPTSILVSELLAFIKNVASISTLSVDGVMNETLCVASSTVNEFCISKLLVLVKSPYSLVYPIILPAKSLSSTYFFVAT